MELEASFLEREFDEFTSLMRNFCTSRPLLSRQILRDHPELLTDRTDELFGSAIEYFRSEGASAKWIGAFERGWAILRVARELGVDAAFAQYLTGEGGDEFSDQDVNDLLNCETSQELADLLGGRPWILTAEFEDRLAQLAGEVREAGHDWPALIVEARRYLVHRCRAADIPLGLAQAYVVQAILGTPKLREQYRLSDAEVMQLMDIVAEFSAQGLPIVWRRQLIESHPELLSRDALELMAMLHSSGLPDTALSSLSMALYLAVRASRDGIEAACRVTALVELYFTDADEAMTVRSFDEYLNHSGEDASSVIEPGDVENLPVHWPSVRRRRLLLEEIRRTRPQRSWDAVMQFSAAYTPDQMRHMLETNPILLAPLAEQLLTRYRDAVAAESDAITLFLLDDRIQIMRRARDAGISTALGESADRHLEHYFAAGGVTREQISRLRADLEDEVAAGSAASVLLDAANAAGPKMFWATLLSKHQPWAALYVLDQAISGTAEGSRERAGLLLSKEGLLQLIAEHSAALTDIDDAIVALEEAGRCDCPESDRIMITGNLGVLWHKRFGLTGRLTDLGRALALLKDAVRRTPRPPAAAAQADLLARRLTNLGLAQDSSLSHPLGGGDIGAVVETLEEAVRLTPDSCQPRVRAKRWSALALALMTREGEGDGVHATQLLREACELAEAAPDGQSLLPGILLNLSAALQHSAGTGHDREQQPAEALALLERACALAGDEQPGVALRSGLSWGRSAGQGGDWENAARGYRYMLRAMQHLAGEQATRFGKEAALIPAAGETSAAAYAIAKAGHDAEAVEALEGARAVVASELLERDRADLDALIADGHSLLATQFEAADSRLRVLGGLAGPSAALPTGGAARQMKDELAQITAEIQRLPGHADFRAAPSITAIARQAPIAYLAASQPGGVAFLVRDKTSVTPVWSGELRASCVEERVDRLLTASSSPVSLPRAVDEVTQWLWDAVMGPLLAEACDLSALTLVPCGLLGLLPLHAAWTPDATRPTGRRYALDDILLTYTLNARATAAAHILASYVPARGVLAVDDPRPADAGPLPYSALECAAALQGAQDPMWLRHEQATKPAVTEALRACSLVHLSCHGEANLGEPLDSALLLSGDRLTLRDLTDLNGIRLAVLSACETARIGGRLPDEMIGFPAAFLVSGVPSVVGSLWSVPSAATAELIARFYANSREAGLGFGEALRQAQQAVRDSMTAEKRSFFEEHFPERPVPVLHPAAGSRPYAQPYHWAAFTYYGA